MSRLDFRRRKQQELERIQSGESKFVSFIKKHSGILILLLIIILVATAFCAIALNPDYANRMSEGGETLYLDENTIYEKPYAAQENTVLKTHGSGAYICTKDKLFMISAAGKTEWEIDVTLNEPILSANGGYILAADRGGKNIYLINNGKIILQTLSTYSIINASVSSDGKFVVISDEPYYKGLVTVKNANDEEVFVWHSGNAYIIDATIGSDTNKLALAVVNTSSALAEATSSLSGGVMLFNLYETEAYSNHTFESEVATNVFRADGGFIAILNTKAVAIDADGKIIGEYVYPATPSKIYKSEQLLVLALEGEGDKKIAVTDNRASEKFVKSMAQLPNFMSADDDRIALGGGNELRVYDSSGKELYLMNTAKKFDTFALFDGAKRGAGLTALSVDILEIK